MNCKMLSGIRFNLDQFKILSSGIVLKGGLMHFQKNVQSRKGKN